MGTFLETVKGAGAYRLVEVHRKEKEGVWGAVYALDRQGNPLPLPEEEVAEAIVSLSQPLLEEVGLGPYDLPERVEVLLGERLVVEVQVGDRLLRKEF